MICSIHQPNYIPYIGLFHKILLSDVFVFYDTAQYTKGDYHNRNTIKGPNGPILLSLPVTVSLGQSITEVSFDSRALNKHWKTIEQSYKKAKYFEEYYKDIQVLFQYNGANLAEFNIQSIQKISSLIGIKTKFITLSSIGQTLESDSSRALVDICGWVSADIYISGSGGRGYIDRSIFEEAHIALQFQDFHHPTHIQLWGNFLPYMSILDALFNEGPNTLSLLKSSGGTVLT